MIQDLFINAMGTLTAVILIGGGCSSVILGVSIILKVIS